ncbi:MAG: hypothetical protein H2069_02345 [Legionella sp.]|nr:hypothetical protein [Legionella sp.]
MYNKQALEAYERHAHVHRFNTATEAQQAGGVAKNKKDAKFNFGLDLGIDWVLPHIQPKLAMDRL